MVTSNPEALTGGERLGAGRVSIQAWGFQAWLPGHVTLGESQSLPEPQFSHLCSEDKYCYLEGL